MKDLIEALQILAKYADDYSAMRPTWCEHDQLHVAGPSPPEMPVDDATRLGQLSFRWVRLSNSWMSFRFGSW